MTSRYAGREALEAKRACMKAIKPSPQERTTRQNASMIQRLAPFLDKAEFASLPCQAQRDSPSLRRSSARWPVSGQQSPQAGLGFERKGEELQVHLVDIAIGILRTNPKEDVTPEDNARSAGCAM
jgi:hypothetical protein